MYNAPETRTHSTKVRIDRIKAVFFKSITLPAFLVVLVPPEKRCEADGKPSLRMRTEESPASRPRREWLCQAVRDSLGWRFYLYKKKALRLIGRHLFVGSLFATSTNWTPCMAAGRKCAGGVIMLEGHIHGSYQLVFIKKSYGLCNCIMSFIIMHGYKIRAKECVWLLIYYASFMYAAPCQTASGICDDCLCTMLLETLYVTVSLLPQIHPQVDCDVPVCRNWQFSGLQYAQTRNDRKIWHRERSDDVLALRTVAKWLQEINTSFIKTTLALG